MYGRLVLNGRPCAAPPASAIPKAAQLLAMVGWPFQTLEYLQHRHGDVVTLRWPANPPRAVIADPSDAAAIFRAPPHTLLPGAGASPLQPIVGDQSFMLADGDRHHHARRTLVSAFQSSEAERHADRMRARAEREIASWPREQPIELYPRLRSLALWTILDVIFEAADYRLDELHTRLLELLSISEQAVLTVAPARHVPPGRRAWARFLRQRDAVDELLGRLVADHHQGATAHGLLAAAVRLERGPPRIAPARDTLMSVILAGHETTASTMAWALQLLAEHPQVLNRTIAAVDAGDQDYVMAVIYEVLRHRPVFVFAIPRTVAEPIQVGRYQTQPPFELLPCIYLIHHDPSIYSSPNAFRPERFCDARPQPIAWLPWGGGRRRCPGLHLAMLELRIVLETTLSKLTLRDPSGVRKGPRWRSVIVTPRDGCRLVVLDR